MPTFVLPVIFKDDWKRNKKNWNFFFFFVLNQQQVNKTETDAFVVRRYRRQKRKCVEGIIAPDKFWLAAASDHTQGT